MTTCATLTVLTCVYAYRVRRGKAVLVFSTAATAKFQEMVAPYMAPSMEYKLLPRFRGLGHGDAAVRRAHPAAGAGTSP